MAASRRSYREILQWRTAMSSFLCIFGRLSRPPHPSQLGASNFFCDRLTNDGRDAHAGLCCVFPDGAQERGRKLDIQRLKFRSRRRAALCGLSTRHDRAQDRCSTLRQGPRFRRALPELFSSPSAARKTGQVPPPLASGRSRGPARVSSFRPPFSYPFRAPPLVALLSTTISFLFFRS